MEKDITFDNIRPMFRTGRSIWVSGTGRDKKFSYRNGVMTPSGDIEESEWQSLAHELITKHGEDELYGQLYEWLKESTPWLHTQAEVQAYTLEMHVGRFFDNPQWADFIPFNRKYRPEVLETADLIEIRYPCCGAVHEVTRAQYLSQYFGGQKYCQACEEWIVPELMEPTKTKDERSLRNYECE